MSETPRRPIADDLGPAERAALGDLDALLARLAAEADPEPPPGADARLLARLGPLVAARATPLAEAAPATPGSWLALARAQLAFVGAELWWACAGVLLLGVVVGAMAGGGALAIAVTALSPLLAVALVVALVRPEGRALAAIERASPTTALELLYVRLGLVLAGSVGLSLALMALAWSAEPGLVLWRALVVWIGPLLGVTGLALASASRLGSVAGVVAPALAWGGLASLGWQAWAAAWDPLREPAVAAALRLINSSDELLAVALGAGLAGVALVAWLAGSLRERPRWS